VLKHAETLALDAGLLKEGDDYSLLASDAVRAFFGQYAIAVGSTGNLGLSIGIMSARWAFAPRCTCRRTRASGRRTSCAATASRWWSTPPTTAWPSRKGASRREGDPACHFVDDENSHDLFLGYAVAGQRLKAQFAASGIAVDAAHPLFVYLPCGVGGGPGGVAFGLKLAFGDHVHCIFVEPTHSPCMLLGVHTGLHEGISVQDIGIDNVTAADGLAVGRPSGFVGRAMQRLIDGYATVTDEELYRLLATLEQTQGLRLEPSAVAGFAGIAAVLAAPQYQPHLAQATHLVWGTGGSMVPEAEMAAYVARGRALLAAGAV
jgi:D-serine dehydratase